MNTKMSIEYISEVNNDVSYSFTPNILRVVLKAKEKAMKGSFYVIKITAGTMDEVIELGYFSKDEMIKLAAFISAGNQIDFTPYNKILRLEEDDKFFTFTWVLAKEVKTRKLNYFDLKDPNSKLKQTEEKPYIELDQGERILKLEKRR